MLTEITLLDETALNELRNLIGKIKVGEFAGSLIDTSAYSERCGVCHLQKKQGYIKFNNKGECTHYPSREISFIETRLGYGVFRIYPVCTKCADTIKTIDQN